MFTGLVETTGRIRRIDEVGGDCRLTIEALAFDRAALTTGESVAVDGVCLTVLPDADRIAFDVSRETLSVTTLGRLTTDQRVNLERSLLPTSRLGGHFVSGHVDAVGTLVERSADARSERLVFEVPDELQKYIAAKGSICVNGVSLTVNGRDASRFDVNLVPHTLSVTTLGDLSEGDSVNIEIDLLARYLINHLEGQT